MLHRVLPSVDETAELKRINYNGSEQEGYRRRAAVRPARGGAWRSPRVRNYYTASNLPFGDHDVAAERANHQGGTAVAEGGLNRPAGNPKGSTAALSIATGVTEENREVRSQ